MADFTANAWIVGGRWRHHRTLDHFGAEDSRYIALAEPIGPWHEGTPVHYVIEDLLNRLLILETATIAVLSAKADAVILAPGGTVESPSGTFTSVFFTDAAIKRSRSGSFLMQAYMAGGGTFTANAILRGAGSFTAKAVIV